LNFTATVLNKTPDTSPRFADVAQRRLIFSINSGRSGSKYLAQLLATAHQVTSFHEAEPKMSGEFIDMINTKPMEASREKRRVKAAAIAEVLRGSGPEEIYAETNHTFITTFYDVVLEEFHNVDVINLRRDLALVLKSFIEMGYFSPLNPLSFAWMSSPNAVTAVLPAIGPDTTLDQFDRCIAYLLDIEARAERFKRDYLNVRTHDVRLVQLNEINFVEDLFARLGITPTAATRKLCGLTSNERKRRKEQIANRTTIEECRKRLAAYIRKTEERGIQIPASALV
jgi:hypothetical protein